MSASDDRARRFERLERARGQGPDGEERPGAGERFEGLEPEPAAPPEPRAPSSSGDRFRPPPERVPELASAGGDEQPFRRCMRCEADASRYAARCDRCGADLRTPEQEDWNRRLWERRQAERAELEVAEAAHHRAEEEARDEAARARRQQAELLARQVGDAERERLEREQGGAGLLRDLWRILFGP